MNKFLRNVGFYLLIIRRHHHHRLFPFAGRRGRTWGTPPFAAGIKEVAWVTVVNNIIDGALKDAERNFYGDAEYSQYRYDVAPLNYRKNVEITAKNPPETAVVDTDAFPPPADPGFWVGVWFYHAAPKAAGAVLWARVARG